MNITTYLDHPVPAQSTTGLHPSLQSIHQANHRHTRDTNQPANIHRIIAWSLLGILLTTVATLNIADWLL